MEFFKNILHVSTEFESHSTGYGWFANTLLELASSFIQLSISLNTLTNTLPLINRLVAIENTTISPKQKLFKYPFYFFLNGIM